MLLFLLPSHSLSLINTHIAIAIPIGHYGRVAPRSGLAFKSGVTAFGETIDADYRGELKVLLRNDSNQKFKVQVGDRIAQLIIEPYAEVTLMQATTLGSTVTTKSTPSPPSFKDTLTPIHTLDIPEEYCKFFPIFEKEGFNQLPKHSSRDHAIELIPGSKLRNCKVYNLSTPEQKALEEFLKENLEMGQIRPSKSPMASPFFFIKKKDGSLRPVQDYRYLNSITIKNRYPLPLISEIINKLKGASVFTKFDVRWGYNNIQIKEGNEWKAAFRTNMGLYEPLVMFFGLTNSPTTFQSIINDIFCEKIEQGFVIVYIDDILIFSESLKEYQEHVIRVLCKLRDNNLFLKPSKCEFHKTTISYLGFVLGQGKISMEQEKVDAIRKWPTPTTKKQLQSFLGFINFY
ncbi:hypothetical protein AX16_006276 [Volvariella volvacea WC 439]|nr:hypothetical protein AX16_006276 [Volvariella volvacea WC 439]